MSFFQGIGNQRALDLLWKYLTQEQRVHFEHSCYRAIQITGSDGNSYEIVGRYQENVYLRDKSGRRVVRYCSVPTWDKELPLYDMMLAQMLTLQADVNVFMEHAIAFPITFPGIY